MVAVEMLTVGKELLIGRTLNTNAHWVGGRLASMGTMLRRVTTVDDNVEEIASALKGCIGRSPDFVMVVGGLGPTPDDMTLKGVAKFLGGEMKLDERAIGMIKEHYLKIGRAGVEITKERMKMAILPSGAEPIVNDVGTAPGVRFVVGKSVVYSLPGVPAEMKKMFRESVEPEVRAKVGTLHTRHVSLKLEGILESALAPMIAGGLKKYPEAYIKSHPKGIRKGISKIELDIVIVDVDGTRAERTARDIESDLSDKVKAAGGAVVARVERGK